MSVETIFQAWAPLAFALVLLAISKLPGQHRNQIYAGLTLIYVGLSAPWGDPVTSLNGIVSASAAMRILVIFFGIHCCIQAASIEENTGDNE